MERRNQALSLLFLVLTVFFFLTTVGLATYAIINAGQVVSCVDNDPTSTPCVAASNRAEYNYWLAGATGAAVLESLFGTFMFCVFAEVARERQSRKPINIPKDLEDLKRSYYTHGYRGGPSSEHHDGAISEPETVRLIHEEGVAIPEGNGGDMGGEEAAGSPVRVSIDVVGGEEVKEWQETTVRSFTPLAGVVLFFGILAAMCALLCILWGIAIAYSQFNPRYLPQWLDGTIKVNVYIVVDVLIGIATPILLFISTVLVAVVVDYVTVGQMDMRRGIGYILSSVAMQEGKENYYWTVLDTFYFPMNKRPHRRDHGLLYSCDRSRYTWYFTIVCALYMLLVFSYFVNVTVTDQVNAVTCPSDLSFVCFADKTFLYVNCSQPLNPSVTLLHCYKFLRFGIDVNLITALSQSFAFYLLITTFFTQVFTVVKGLISIKPSRFWGIGLILFSGLLIGGAIAVLLRSDVLVAYTDIISILEFFMVGAVVFVIGLLVVEGKWWEKLPSYSPRDLHLAQYGSTSQRRLKEIEHTAALEANSGEEILHQTIAPTK